MIVIAVSPYWVDNNVESRSLIPNMSVNRIITSNITINLTMIGYQGKCNIDQSQSFKKCASQISVTTDSIESQNDEILCMSSPSEIPTNQNCTISYVCIECSIPPAKIISQISFLIQEQFSFARGYKYSIETTSGYEGQNSIIEQNIFPDYDKFFRGTNVATSVNVQLVQTTHTTSAENKILTGFHVDLLGIEKGYQVDAKSFNHYNGLKFNVILQKTYYSLEVKVDVRKTIPGLISEILASTSGLMGMMVVLMRHNERFNFLFRKWWNRGKEVVRNSIMAKKKKKNLLHELTEELLDVVE